MSVNSEFNFVVSAIRHMVHFVKTIMDETGRLFATRDLEVRRVAWESIASISSTLEEARKDTVQHILMHIARTQPLGRDLVAAYVLINITYDLYRISRYCREIARIDQLLTPSRSLTELGRGALFSKVLRAVQVALGDLESWKPANAEIVREIDREVDRVYEEVLRDAVSKEVATGMNALEALVVRHMERIVDHANYIEQYLEELAR